MVEQFDNWPVCKRDLVEESYLSSVIEQVNNLVDELCHQGSSLLSSESDSRESAIES